MNRDATPQRKFVVFVSSVTSEFSDLRRNLWISIYKAGHIPVVLEENPSVPNKVRQYIEKQVKETDIFVFVLGQEYGRRGTTQPEVPSYIDFELDLAMQNRLPIIFLNATKAAKANVGKFPEQQHIDEQHARIIDKLRNYKGAMHEIELSLPAQGEPPNNFAFTLQTIASSLETGGWIPARWYEEKEKQITLGETVSQNPFFLRFVQRLDSFHTLSKRTIVAQDEKEAIAEFFWDVFLPRLPLFKVDRLFFESGSTIAYLSYEFQKRTRRRWVRKWLDEAQFEIKTNNILTYLDFILADPYADPVECTLCPPAPADTYYGATFGELTSGVEMWPPSEPRRLRADAKSATKKMLASLDFKPESTLILMTASGLDDKTQGFHGPHVGSYYNMLFKRLLITSGVPAVVVLEQGKVSKPFLNGRCFPVCDDDGGTSWAAICRDKPLAIATCASTESVRELGKKLRELGFHEQIAGEPIERSGTSSAESRGKGGLSCIVAANSHFSERFKLQRPAAAAMPHAAAPGTT